MKQSKFTQSQIVGMLREYESGVAVTDICRKNSVYPKHSTAGRTNIAA